MATSVTKTILTETSHRLSKHKGACKNIHGHTYRWDVTLKADQINFEGMIVDFAELKAVMNIVIKEKYDHALVLAHDDDLVNIIRFHTKTLILDLDPTAENMAFLVQRDIKKRFPDCDVTVTVWETPTSFASYTCEEKFE